MAITFTTKNKKKQLRSIEKQIKNQLKPLNLPSTAEVQESRITGEMDDLVEVLEKGSLRPFIEQIESFADDRFTTIEVAAALLKKVTSANESPEQSDGTNTNRSYDDSAMIKMHFNVGKKNNVYPGDLVGAIAGESNVPGNVIGNIDIHPHHSFVDVPGKHVEDVLKFMNRNRVKGKKVSVKVA